MTSRSWPPVLILASSALAMLEGVGGGSSPLRSLVVAWFIVVCPGLAIIGVIGLRDPWLEAALVPALSLATAAVVGGVLSYSGLWSPATGIIVLVAISVTGALARDVLAERRSGARGGP